MGKFCTLDCKKGGKMNLEIAMKLISYPTITPQECGIYEYISTLLKGFSYERMDCEEVKNAFFYKDFSPHKKEGKIHLCFAGHIDVVPAGEDWESHPFEPTLKGEYLYGRGAQDMKGGISSFLDAIGKIQKEGVEGNLAISVLLTSDEEGVGINGTRYVLECLAKNNRLPHFALVAEPTCESVVGDMIKIGRRGSINGVLKIFGKQGHVAYPSKCINPIELLGSKLGEIAGKDLDNGDENFEPSKIVVTDIRGGMQVCNVTPSELTIMFNIRNSTLTTQENVKRYFENLLSHLEYDLKLTISSYPFLTSKENKLTLHLLDCIEEIVGIKPKVSCSGGTSDARYFAPYGIGVVEFGVCNDRIHAKNERVKLQDLDNLTKIFKKLIQSFCKESL